MEAFLYELGTLRIVRRFKVDAGRLPGWIWSTDMTRGFQLKSTSPDASRAFYVEQRIAFAEIVSTDASTAEPDAPLYVDDSPTVQVIEAPAPRARPALSSFVDEPEPPTAEDLRHLFDD